MEQILLYTIYGTDLKRVEDFKYIGAWVDSSENMKNQKSASLENMPPYEKHLELKTQ